MRPVLILQHDSTQRPGQLLAQLTQSGIDTRIVMPDHGDAVPHQASDYSGIVLLGSNRSVNEPLGWIDDELDLLRRALAADVPMLGHCFGGQMMARAMGARVGRSGLANIGWSRLHVTPAGMRLLQAQEVTAFNWHYETFQIPAGARRLLYGTHCLNKGFEIGPHLAFQCHFEVDESIIRDWCSQSADELSRAKGPAVQAPSMILKDLPQRVAELHRIARLVYSEWTSRLPGPAARRAVAVNSH
ncbi:MAG TPA: type 1 glutamine amidotransferase [Roseateles sp.]|nr:type 1 glutamine amidotransferase [Roseateles sp.]